VKTSPLSNRTVILLLGLGVGIAVAWKLVLLYLGAFPFNADEAIVALMARHILAGEMPIFFYGQAYMGSLDAFLVAALFRIAGESVAGIRYTQILLYSGILLTTYWLAQLLFRSKTAGLLAVALLTIPTVNMTVYTTVSLGGYGEALLIGNLILCIGFWITLKREAPLSILPQIRIFFLWGFLAGLGVWTNGLTLVYILPMGIYLLVWLIRSKETRRILAGLLPLIIGVLLGASPWIAYAIQNTPQYLIQELFGSAVAVESGNWLSQVGLHALSFILFGIPVILGFRPPWEIRWLVLPLIPFVAAFWFLVVRYGIKNTRSANLLEKWRRAIPFIAVLLIIILFIFTHFGADPSGRYFLPINIILTVFAGFFIQDGISKKSLKMGCVTLVIVFQFLGTLQCVQRNPPGLTTQFDTTTVIDHSYDDDLIAFLREKKQTRGFTNYWVAYPLAFLSGEELIFTPRLPYHQDLRYTPRDDRFAPYDQMVDGSQRRALITTNNLPLNDYLRRFLTKKEITWQEKQIGDYLVFYDLSRRILVEELDFANQP
jgi:4-amino-4-deoxy-L-arabinose transferase-like glycosyltransferase